MQTISTIGLDIAKSVFQVHGVDAAGQVVARRQLKRRYVLAFFEKLPPCMVGIEACASRETPTRWQPPRSATSSRGRSSTHPRRVSWPACHPGLSVPRGLALRA